MDAEMSDTLDLAMELVSRASVTPEDAGCQALMMRRLQAIGFDCTPLRFGEVDNLWARLGDSAPLFVFAGHTDVVPSGPVEQWRSDPFAPTIEGDILIGRGAVDMKSSIAAMVCACERFLGGRSDFASAGKGSIGFLITSDEEGPAVNGTVKVIEKLQGRSEDIEWCLVGEPSSTSRVGDVVKNGRRGSLGGVLVVQGVQGHVAYPQLARNPVHAAVPALTELTATEWDQGNEFFPKTTFQISNIHAGTGATNVIPGTCEVVFNFRYSTENDPDSLRTRVEALLDRHDLDYAITWIPSGPPFLTPGGALIEAAQAAIQTVAGFTTQLSTAGGTSDGRFIEPTGAPVLKLGPRNAAIHMVNDCVGVDDLDRLSQMYQRILEGLLAS